MESNIDDDYDDDDDIDIEGIIGMHTPTSIFSKWKPTLSHLSVSTAIQFRQCPLSFFFKNAINLDTGNIYAFAGIKLHELLENFYYNIACPIPNSIIIPDGEQTEIKIDKSKDGINEYFSIVLNMLSDVMNLNEILTYDNSSRVSRDLYAGAIKTLDAFAKDETIRYLNTPPNLFKPVIIEGKIQYRIDNLPVPILGYIDVVLPSPDPTVKELIPKDYKNRSDISGKLYDKIQAYIYALGIHKLYDYTPRKFIFKQIHYKHLKNAQLLYDKNIYPILPETVVKVSPKKFQNIENIMSKIYADMMDKSNYKFHFDRDKCPNYFCNYKPVCLINGFIHDEYIRPIHNELANARFEKKNIKLPMIHVRDGEELNPFKDGFQSVGEYLGNA